MPVRDEQYMRDQRLRILEATFKCLSRQGLQKSSLRAICKEAGIAVGTLYIHFKDRAEILSSLHYLVEERPLKEIEFSTWQDFRDYLISTINFKDNPAILGYINCDLKLAAEAQNGGELKHVMVKNNKETIIFLKRCLSHLVTQKKIKLPLGLDNTARAIRYLLSGIAFTQQFEGEEEQNNLVEVFNETISTLVICDCVI